MFVSRIARLAGRFRLELPTVLDSVRLGLIGTVRAVSAIRICTSRRAEEGLQDLGYAAHELRALLSNGTVQAVVDKRGGTSSIDLERIARGESLTDDVSLIVESPEIQARLILKSNCFLVVAVNRPRGLHNSVLLLGEFDEQDDPSFDGVEMIQLIAREQRLRKFQHTALARDEQADHRLMRPYRRYLENVRHYVSESPPRAPYKIESRMPLKLSTDGDWPRLFTFAETPFTFFCKSGQSRTIEVAGLSDDGDLLILDGNDAEDEILERGTLTIPPQFGPVDRMLDALHAIAEGGREPYLNLLEALRAPHQLPDFGPAMFEQIELGPKNLENSRQHEAVAMALACPDLCLVHGPPGTGKTKVICELVMHLARAGQRVLLVAPTHVALDNVLERIGDKPGVVAIRLGASDNVDDRARKYLIGNRSRSLSDALAERLRSALAAAPPNDAVVAVQRAWLEQIESTPERIGEALILNANLICATPIGIAMSREFRQPEPIFDVMIMDESSKATLTDFLVPASRAKRWILVGDHMQLAPYAGQAELSAIISVRTDRNAMDLPDRTWMDEVARSLTWHFEQRLHPDESMRRQAWERLLHSVFGDDFNDQLLEIAATEDAWRNVSSELGTRGRFIAELLDVQQVSMPSVFERLLRLPPSRIVRLNHQFRMLPELATFSGNAVYDGDYHSAQNGSARAGLAIPTLEEPSIWIDTAAKPAAKRYESPHTSAWNGGHYSNAFEVQLAVEVVDRAITWAAESWHEKDAHSGKPRPFEIGVISFYAEQAKALKAAIFRQFTEQEGGRWRRQARRPAANSMPIDVHVSIVDRFQGQEKDLIVISATRSNPIGRRGHVNNINRLNVAVTRARCKRIIIGDSSTLVTRGSHPREPSDLLARLFSECAVKRLWGQAFRMERRP